MQRFRIKTLLIFHGTVVKRARQRAKLARPRRSRGSAAFGGAPGAERESFSLLGLSRDWLKFSVRFLSPTSAPEYTESWKLTPLICHGTAVKRARHAAKRHNPGEAGVGASEACRRARNVRVFQFLVYHGSVRNSEVFLLLPLLQRNEQLLLPPHDRQ
jgi:hypothetical protein